MRKILYIILGIFLGLAITVQAAPSVFQTNQGGTGTSTPSGILYGDNTFGDPLQTVGIGSNLTFSGGILSATGGGSGGSGIATTSLAATFPVLLNVSSSKATFSFGGLSTSTPAVIGNIPYYSGVNTFANEATSSLGAGSSIVATDVNGNTGFNNYFGATATNVGSGTTTLTIASPRIEYFTSGGGNFVVQLPNAQTLQDGWQFELNNNSNGNLVVKDTTGATISSITTIASGGYAVVELLTNSFPAGTWDSYIVGPGNATWGTAGLSITGTLGVSGVTTLANSLSGLLYGASGVVNSQATSTLTASSPLTGSFTQIGSGGSLGIQAASASQNGYLSINGFNLLNAATTTFSSPLSYSNSTNAVTCPTCNTSNASVSSITPGSDISGSSNPITTTGTLNLALGFNPLVEGYLQATSSATSTISGGLYATLLAAPYFDATSTTATSTFNNGINLVGGCLEIGGSCFSSGGSTVPGGVNTDVQFNNNGSFGGNNTFTFGTTTGQLSLPYNGWYSLNGNLFGYASSTNNDTIVGIGSGGNSATTSNTSNYEVALGNNVLSVNTGARNTGVGYDALNANTSGANNTAIGYNSLFQHTTTGSQDTAIGMDAGSGQQGSYNTFLGYDSGGNPNNSADGTDNVYLGAQSGNAGSGSNANIIIGSGVEQPVIGGTRQLNIGNIIYGTNSYNNNGAAGGSFTPVTNGNIGVGSTTPFSQFAIHAPFGSTNTILFAIASSSQAATTTLLTYSANGVLADSGAGTSTFANGISITGGCFYINNNCLSSSSGTVTSVSGSGGTTGLTLSGGPITTSGTLTLGGTLAVADGGTGDTTLGAGQLLYGNGTGVVGSVATSTLMASAPLTGSLVQIGSGGSLGIQVASASQNGYLSSTDWNTFNGKGSGSVTSIIAGSNLFGGTITTSGTIGLALQLQPLTVGSIVATTTATSTMSGGFYATNVFAPYLSATSTTATSTLNGTILADLGGAVGVGTTTPQGIFSVGNAVATGGFYIAANGNLGVGSSTPSMGLSIQGVNEFFANGQLGSLVASTTGAVTQNINWNAGNEQFVLLGANTAFNVTSTSSNPIGGPYKLDICQGGAGSYTISFPNPYALRWTGYAAATTTMGMAQSFGQGMSLIFDYNNNRGIYAISSSTYACQ